MNKKVLVLGIIAVVVIIAGVSFYMNSSTGVTNPAPTGPAVPGTQPVSPTTTSNASTAKSAMTSTGQLFSQYPYANKSFEVFPTSVATAAKALGAFSITQTSLGNNTYKVILANSAEGSVQQSVTVTGDQKVYFIERSSGDDSATEDSVTTDDILVAVDAQGTILK